MITTRCRQMLLGVSNVGDAPTGNRMKGGREALRDAAGAIFFEQGYAATRIDDISERAGGSKRNIYVEFGSKEGLFTAIVSQHAERAVAALSLGDPSAGSLKDMLLAFGRQLLDISLSPALVGVYRIAATEYARFPDLVRQFYELGRGLRAGHWPKFCRRRRRGARSNPA